VHGSAVIEDDGAPTQETPTRSGARGVPATSELCFTQIRPTANRRRRLSLGILGVLFLGASTGVAAALGLHSPAAPFMSWVDGGLTAGAVFCVVLLAVRDEGGGDRGLRPGVAAVPAVAAQPPVYVRQLDRKLPGPVRAHPCDGGVDLCSTTAAVLAPQDRAVLGTGVCVAIPAGYAGWVVPRSGLAAKQGLTVVNSPGLVDSGYTGEVKVILLNTGTEPILISRGDRIAQLAVTAVLVSPWVPVEVLPGQSPDGHSAGPGVAGGTEGRRGTDGFGSTGTGSTSPDSSL
jgi:dUTP pyrophosphatase